MPQTFGDHPEDIPESFFCPIYFPVLARLDEWTGDGRLIESAGFGVRDLPLSIFFMRAQNGGHDGSEVSGMIDKVIIHDDGLVEGWGWLLDDRLGHDTARLIKAKALRGNSIDLAVEDYQLEIEESDDNVKLNVRFTKSKLAGTTIVPIPAFEGASAEIPDDVGVPRADEALLASMGSFSTLQEQLLVRPSVVQFKVTPITNVVKDEKPPASDFAQPTFDGPTPIMVDSREHAFGHIAAWGSLHLDAQGVRVTPPRSRHDYAYYATGHVLADAGMLDTARLIIGGDHAAGDLVWTKAIDHYAATSQAWADVCVGEDDYGIWVSGRVRPGTDPKQVYAARASGLSGDWRRIGGDLELVAALSVNAPAFPIARPRAFAHKDVQLALIGAGRIPAQLTPILGGSVFSERTETAIQYLADRAARDEARELAAAFEVD